MTANISKRFSAATQNILSLPQSDILDIIKNIDMTRVNNLPGLQELAQAIAEMRDHSLPDGRILTNRQEDSYLLDRTLTNDALYGIQGIPFKNLKEELLKRPDILERCPEAIHALVHDVGVIKQVCCSPVIAAASPETIDFILQLEREEAGKKEWDKGYYWLGLTSNPAIQAHPERIRALMATCLSQTYEQQQGIACSNLAANPAIEVCPDVIVELAQTDNGGAQFKLSYNKAIHASPETILFLAQENDSGNDLGLSENPAISASPAAIAVIFERYKLETDYTSHIHSLIDLARNPGTVKNPEVIEGLAHHIITVQKSLARNPALGECPSAVDILSHAYISVLRPLAASAALAQSEDAIKRLANHKSKDLEMIEALLSNDALKEHPEIAALRKREEPAYNAVVNELLYQPN
jgi:hypothetical protein